MPTKDSRPPSVVQSAGPRAGSGEKKRGTETMKRDDYEWIRRAGSFSDLKTPRNKPRERFLFGCLLVAIMIGTIAIKSWIMTVEQRLADNLQIHWDGVGTDHSQINVLEIHEFRLRKLELTSWALWDRGPLRQGANNE